MTQLIVVILFYLVRNRLLRLVKRLIEVFVDESRELPVVDEVVRQ
jgi:hypothetical protein